MCIRGHAGYSAPGDTRHEYWVLLGENGKVCLARTGSGSSFQLRLRSRLLEEDAVTRSGITTTPGRARRSTGPAEGNDLLSHITCSFNGINRSTFCGTLDACFVICIADSLFSNISGTLTAGLVNIVANLIIIVHVTRVFVSPLLNGVVSGAGAG